MEKSLLDSAIVMDEQPPQKVQAVRIACDGEAQKPFLTKRFSLYQLPPTHEIFTLGELSHISLYVNMPLRVWKVRPSLLVRQKHSKRGGKDNHDPRFKQGDFMYSSREDGKYYPNTIAQNLLVNCFEDTATTPFFSPLPGWTDHVGSVIIARQDGKPLYPAHLTVLIEFVSSCCHNVMPKNELELEAMLTPSEYTAYYGWVLQEAEKGRVEHEVHGVPPPFSEEEIQAFVEQASADVVMS